jgi:poly-gamma-glutamate synthesis protein (capsule biosynthesis protein)
MIDIVIGGDIWPGGRNLSHFISGDAKSIFNDLLPELENADLSVVNLECPLIEESSPIEKNGPVLGAESGCINAIKHAGIDVLNLPTTILWTIPKGLSNTLRSGGLSNYDCWRGRSLEEAKKCSCKQ